MVAGKVNYEELRRQRLEENKKRMEELHLPILSQALKNQSSPKPSPMKRSVPRIARKEIVAVRRSSRVANNPAPVYREIVTYERHEYVRRTASGYRKRDLSNRIYASDKARAVATLKAQELELSLGTEYPTFVKPMTQSHVTGGFWLGLPSYFCRNHMSRRDETVTLVDEVEEEFPVVYLGRKSGLSGGWKAFAVAHDLVDGDAVVFQLIRSTKFKVYIVRVEQPKESSDVSEEEDVDV